MALGLGLVAPCAAAAPAAADLASHVDVFAGTRPGPRTFGGGHNYPGAALPFGMVQWSPDTTPAKSSIYTLGSPYSLEPMSWCSGAIPMMKTIPTPS